MPSTPQSTIQLSRTIAFAQTFNQNRLLTNVQGNVTEPGYSIADWVKQFILAPPLAWRWNRSTATQAVTPSTQDYSIYLPTFGWLEKATCTNAATGAVIELEINLNLGQDISVQQPAFISTQADDGQGNITFRLFPQLDTNYTLTVYYQNAAQLFTSTTQTWAPIPDYLSVVYNQGYLAKTYEYADSSRFGPAMELFLRMVVNASEGLSDSQRNIFLNAQLNTQRELQRNIKQPIS